MVKCINDIPRYGQSSGFPRKTGIYYIIGESEPFSPKNPALSPEVEMAGVAREACGASAPASHKGK